MDGNGFNANGLTTGYGLVLPTNPQPWFTNVLMQDGALNQALVINDTTGTLKPPSCASCPQDDGLALHGNASVQAWIKPAPPQDSTTQLDVLSMTIDPTSQMAGGWAIRLLPSATKWAVQLCWEGGKACATASESAALIAPNAWTQIVIEVAPQGMPTGGNITLEFTLFVNGASVHSSVESTMRFNTAPEESPVLAVGGLDGTKASYKGLIDELAIWPCNLSPGDVQVLHERKFAYRQ